MLLGMGDAKLDDASSGVKDTLTEAGGLMEETAELLDGFSQEVKDGRQAFYRAESAVASGRALVALPDPSITPKQVASDVKEKAEDLLANVRQAEPSGGTDGGTIAGPAEQLLIALNNLRQPDAVEEKAKDAARRYSQSLNPRMQAIKREIDALEAQLSELSESTSSQSTGISERLDVLKGELESAGTRIDELISDQDAKFTEAQEKRREEHTQAINDATERLTEARSSFEDRRDEATARLDEIEKEVAEAAAAIGASTAGVDHGAESVQQTKLALRWSLATILLLLAAALVSIFALEILKANQSPEAVAGKITVALLIEPGRV
jgi:predicted  nucleic acid-binding Zn-ribbon protein